MESKNKIWRSLLTMALLLSVLFLNNWILYVSFEKVREQQRWVSRTGDVIDELDQILLALINMETGQRGYLLTHSDQFLEPYRAGAVDLEKHVEKLKSLMGDSPDQLNEAGALEKIVNQRIELLDQSLDKMKTRGMGEAEKRDLHFQGKQLMDLARDEVNKMRANEGKILAQRTEDAARSRVLFLLALVLTTFVGAAAIWFAYRQTRRNQTRLEREALERASTSRIRDKLAQLGVAVAGDLSRQELAQKVQEFLAQQLGILSSRFLSHEGNRLELVRSAATREAVQIHERNLADEAMARSDLWLVDRVPRDYWHISSELGSALPTLLGFLPLVFQGRRLGVIEMAFFQRPSLEDEEVLKRGAELIAIGLSAAQAREDLQSLLEKTQQQAEELEAQQEELIASNEELEQQARAMESQQQSLNIKNQELEAARLELEMKAQELQQSSQYKSDFLAKMSHELRTPLNGLLILSSLLIENKEDNLTDQQTQFLRSIQSAGNDLLLLINDILDLSKIEARKLRLKAERFSIRDMLEQLRLAFEPQANSKGLEFRIVMATDLGDGEMNTDRLRLEQILRNFLSNAVKFTEKGHIAIEASYASGGKKVSFSVADSGIGIPPEKRAVIFEAFEQADGSVARRFGGTGLGLTIGRELAHLLGGEIKLESQEGQGSRFTIVIPLDLESAEKAPTRASAPTTLAAKSSSDLTDIGANVKDVGKAIAKDVEEALRGISPDSKKTILVVEDDERFLNSVLEVARQQDFLPIAARAGEVALGILERHTPAAILLDIKLPGISGMGLLEMIKSVPLWRHIPVHMISALDYQHNALRMGALGYLTKPVTMDKVRAALERIQGMISGAMRRILLIEDDETQRLAISNLISGEDVEVVTTATGRGAIEQLKGSVFDCIVLDLNLPDTSGFDLLDQLNRLEISLPPIVIYTGKDLSRDEEVHLYKFSESIIIKGARSPERLLDEVNLFLHRVESLMPTEKRQMLSSLRTQVENFQGKTVLLVDDDLRNVFALTSALESKNLSVRIAKNGYEALEALEQHSDIDLVLMDIMMPLMDGFEAMRRIRASSDPRLKQLPVIALTAKAMREDHEKCIEAGASDYIPKPVNLDHLTTVLKVWLSNRGMFS